MENPSDSDELDFDEWVSDFDDFNSTFLGPPISQYKWAIFNPRPLEDKRWYYIKPFVGGMLDDFIASKRDFHTRLLSAEGGSKQYGFVWSYLTSESGHRYKVPLILEAIFVRTKERIFIPVANSVKLFWEVKQLEQHHRNSAALVVETLNAKFGPVKHVIKRDRRVHNEFTDEIIGGALDQTFDQKVFGPNLDSFSWIIFIPKEGVWYFVKEEIAEKINKFVSSDKEFDTQLILCDGNATTHSLVYSSAYSGNDLLFEKILLLRANFEKIEGNCFRPIRNSVSHFWELVRLPQYHDTHASDIFEFIRKRYGKVKKAQNKPFYKNEN